ncbi:glycosyltransferase [Halochromatium salexigens]|uniref:Glycosyltransferase n=2 Tax=Halochromatium salexigens TaxID=49447 RepID=A0AAJ0UF52_HALSE|nr:glycosyltransferase [Halochromatium salexigens]MBK5930310.1 glycosyltransferase [Halochromatium salexigens]
MTSHAEAHPDRLASAHWPSSLQLIGSKGLGGAERWFQRFCEALAERQAPAAIGLRAGGELDRLRGQQGLDARLPCHRLPFRTVWDPLSRLAVERLVRRVKPQIVQTYMGRATRLTRLSRRPGLGLARPVHLTRLGGYYDLSPYRHADAWIGNTRQLCDWMLQQGLPARRVHQIYNFVDPPQPLPAAELAQRRRQLGVHADEQLLLCMGRFVTVKGQRYLLDALARLPAELGGRRWRLLLLGEGPLRQRLQRQARELGIDSRILWLGWQPEPAPYLQLADLVVFPSLETETLGNVILEAWAWRRPLVTAAFRGAREITHHGKDAWCVPCEDAPALAEGIRLLLREPALAKALVEQGAQRVEQTFSRTVIMQRYLELYTDLTDG